MNQIAHPDDISLASAVAAHQHTSHAPEERAAQIRQGYADHVNGLHKELQSIAHSAAQKAELRAQMERYRTRYIEKLLAWLAARSRCASTMITGPANFNTARNEKANRSADKRADELQQFTEKAKRAIARAIADLRTPQEVEDADFMRITRGFASSLTAIREIDAGVSPYTRGAFTTSITGKMRRIAQSGDAALLTRLQEWLKKNNNHGLKPALAGHSQVWKLRATPPPAVSTVDEQENGVRLYTDDQANRVRLVFPDKPSADVRNKLKASGWRWSPITRSWQRKLTENAIAAGREFLVEA
jgi:hypothetical protein